jgi:hypothetical protein
MDKETVERAKKESDEAYLIYSNMKEQYKAAEQDWLKKSRRFKDFDYKLALTDGRLKKIPPAGECKQKKTPELTLEQLRTIAEKLGVNITVDETVTNQENINTLVEEENESSEAK